VPASPCAERLHLGFRVWSADSSSIADRTLCVAWTGADGPIVATVAGQTPATDPHKPVRLEKRKEQGLNMHAMQTRAAKAVYGKPFACTTIIVRLQAVLEGVINQGKSWGEDLETVY